MIPTLNYKESAAAATTIIKVSDTNLNYYFQTLVTTCIQELLVQTHGK